MPPCGDDPHAGRDERLDESVGERRPEAGDLAGRLHLDAQERVGAGELEEGELRDLHPPAARGERGDPVCASGRPSIARAASRRSGTPVAFVRNGSERLARRLSSMIW